MPTSTVTLPHTCKCGALRGLLVDGKIACADCGVDRGTLPDTTQRFVAGIVAHFGEPKEPIVLRKPDVAAKITEHDAFLKRKFTRDGKTWFDIIRQAAAGLVGDEHFIVDPEQEESP